MAQNAAAGRRQDVWIAARLRRLMDELIEQVERELVEVQPDRDATFADAALEWREWAENTKRLRPATLRNYDALLSPPAMRHRGGGARLARIMRAFGTRRIAEITTADVEGFLRGLDRAGLPGRSVNSHRQALMNVFEYATRPDGFALTTNPVRATDKRREEYSKPPETFTAEEVLALARAARAGRHVNGGRRWASSDDDFEQQRFNEQDAAIYTVAGFTGLRQGELRALRWRHVRFEDRTLVVVASMSAGVEGATSQANGAPFRSRARHSSPLTNSTDATGSPAPRTTCSAVLPVTRSRNPRSAAGSGRTRDAPACPRCRSTI